MRTKNNLVKGALYTSVAMATLFSTQLGNEQVVRASTQDSGTQNKSTEQVSVQKTSDNNTQPKDAQEYDRNVAIAQDQLDQANQEAKTKQEQAEKAKNDLAAKQAEIEQAQKDAEAAKQAAAAVDQATKDVQAKIDETQKKSDALPATQEDAQKQADKAKDDLAASEQKVNEQQSQVNAAQDQANAADKQQQTAQSAFDAANNKVNNGEQAANAASDAVDKAQQDVNSHQVTEDAQAKAVAAAKDKLAQNAADQAALNQKIAEAEKEKAAAEAPQSVVDFSQDYSNILLDSKFTGEQHIVQPMPENQQYVPNMDNVRTYFTQYLNQLRALNGQPPIQMSESMTEVAQKYADMQTPGNIQHYGSPYFENVGQVGGVLSDKEFAYDLLTGWYDETNNLYPAGNSKHYGHRANLLYTAGSFGIAYNPAAGAATFEADGFGMTSAQSKLWSSLFYSKGSSDTKALPNFIFDYTVEKPADQAKAAALGVQISQMNAQLDTLVKAGKVLENNVQTEQAALNALHDEDAKLNQALNDATAAKTKADAQLEASRQDLTNAQASLASSTGAVTKAHAQLDSAKADLLKAQQDADAAKTRADEAAKIVQSLSSMKAALAKELATAKDELRAAQLDSADKQQALVAAQDKLASLEAGLPALKTNLSRAQAEFATALLAVHDAEANLEQVKANKSDDMIQAEKEVQEKAEQQKKREEQRKQEEKKKQEEQRRKEAEEKAKGQQNKTDKEADQGTTRPQPLDVKTKTDEGQHLKPLAAKPATSITAEKSYPQTGDTNSLVSMVVGLIVTLFSMMALLFKSKKA
ncbi:LPXTG cell wall anchor domain-containing protein [Lacticaseibacillus zeae]|uniref:LPXTG cell wall anchor domain-containing protein n=1 Tax=Lacticaseibacillus zeae TaxID=57037 RepID=A0A5R8LGW0_LACZE|nr:CAP domain-containing protein [Lacticaseibacillus zeae]TLF36035.1 LPXTG cell wall anchor domain-containing protein [Lacticaseibacillus zeae]